MNRILCCDWLPRAILPTQDTGFVPQGKFIMFWCFIPYNKSFTEQACSVKTAGYWPRSFFCLFMDLDFVLDNEHAEKELGQYPAILTSCWVNNPYIQESCNYHHVMNVCSVRVSMNISFKTRLCLKN